MITRDADGKVFKVKRNDVDMYVCGFPCNPWSARGRSGEDCGSPGRPTWPCPQSVGGRVPSSPHEGTRDGFASESADCFFTSVKTIAVVQPKVFILENVSEILREPHLTQLKSTMDKLKSYQWKAEIVDSFDHGVPQRRRRAYVVGIRSDNGVHGDRRDVEDMLRDIFDDMRQVHCRSGPWPKYLKAPREAQRLQGWSSSGTDADVILVAHRLSSHVRIVR